MTEREGEKRPHRRPRDLRGHQLSPLAEGEGEGGGGGAAARVWVASRVAPERESVSVDFFFVK
jgi:hypothetical protein